MGHLTIEELARLVSEDPTPEARKHLEACPACKAELAALVAQTEAIGSLPDLRPPSGDWEALEARLVSEGLIVSSGLRARGSHWRNRGWLQAAAAVVLFLGGAVIGPRLTASGSPGDMAQSSPPPGLELVPVSSQMPPATNLAEAAEVVRGAERQYVDALLRYRQLLDAQGNPGYIGDPTARFAALEAIVAASRAAVQQAPADPYVNGVLVSALAEREALLRNASLTTGSGIY